jgi:hypothetical protein
VLCLSTRSSSTKRGHRVTDVGYGNGKKKGINSIQFAFHVEPAGGVVGEKGPETEGKAPFIFLSEKGFISSPASTGTVIICGRNSKMREWR